LYASRREAVTGLITIQVAILIAASPCHPGLAPGSSKQGLLEVSPQSSDLRSRRSGRDDKVGRYCPGRPAIALCHPGLAPGSVRPRGRSLSSVEVRTGVGQGPVAEGNCVAARRGGKQPEANWRSAG